MILSGLEIRNKLGKEIKIEPFDERFLNPNSYNLRLYNHSIVGQYKIYSSGKYQNNTSI